MQGRCGAWDHVTRQGRDEAERPNHQDVRAALGRVIANPVLAKSPQLAHFLSFIVEETLAGRGDRLKAYTIATDGLGRDAKFDPQTDPIVRVEAGRLRRALEQYYATDGRNDPVVIEMPLGHYAPSFRANTALRRAASRAEDWPSWSAGKLRDNFRLVLFVAAIAALVSLSFDLLWMVLGKEGYITTETRQQIPSATPKND